MPIRPENRARYPKAWKAIADGIRDRAGNRCEGSPDFPDCRVPNYSIGYRNDAGVWVEKGRGDMQELADLSFYWGDIQKLTRIVLTVAHLDHTPENCDPSNLRAMCQRCHLNYDKAHHAQTAYATRKARANTADMFSEAV